MNDELAYLPPVYLCSL